MNEGGQPSNLRPVSKEPWSADADLHELEQNHRPGSLFCHGLLEVSTEKKFDSMIYFLRFDGALNVDLNEFQTNLVRETFLNSCQTDVNFRCPILAFISPLSPMHQF